MKPACSALGYWFKNKKLLQLALTHRSCSRDNNERLEFLGDALLSSIISSYLYALEPAIAEGLLTRYRAELVKKDTLAELAQELSVGPSIRMSISEKKSGGLKKPSILASTLEALIAAIYLDGGYQACEKTILKWFSTRLAELHQLGEHKDPKSLLQEYIQSKQLPLPTYSVEKIEGSDHNQTFFVACSVAGLDGIAHGQGRSRRIAEGHAAAQLMRVIS